ncbi:MAG: 16S rRNA (uracil(1498)-N(3))-methyltransferase [Gammaproteobacteria bacterium]|nr:16S rRNA (uracil(1498)-N(3))-methyltransferase [Gammaproteobacteria bacterium]MDH5735487.1 16S rRNA (uracil(1498)-N(3))-methyltransferase [Gammaproteobacteria bacterium]
MRTIRIYIDTPLIIDTTIELDRQAASHLTRVLRLRNNDCFTVFNGSDGEYTAQLVLDNKKSFAKIISHKNTTTQSCISITLLQCISKGDRMDFAIQKATELGTNTIIPIISEHTVVNLKEDRWEKKLNHWQSVAISACEQCGRNDIPDIRSPITLQEQLANTMTGTKLIFDPLSKTSFSSIKPETTHFWLLIGPEGGLSEREIMHAKESGFSGIKIGQRILRTETAALAGITAIQTLWGDFRS